MIAASVHGPVVVTSKYLDKKINDIKDVMYFKTNTIAYKNMVTFIDSLCSKIYGLGRNFSSKKYQIDSPIIQKCADFLDVLEKLCEQTDLKLGQTGGTNRFGLAAYRDWYDEMRKLCDDFIEKELMTHCEDSDEVFKEELSHYISDSFGNRMRIDYGTGHELNFIIFCMGLCNILTKPKLDSPGDTEEFNKSTITPEKLKEYVNQHGLDILDLFSFKYIRLCRKIQGKFRLEPAGSRGVYNMDDYQFLPFLFGAAQLASSRGISVKQFYDQDMVEMFRNDYIFFEAIDFILKMKRGPFNEHSYTLWNYSSLGSWDNLYRRIRSKFDDEVLSPFPIVQHLLFGQNILKWDKHNHQ